MKNKLVKKKIIIATVIFIIIVTIGTVLIVILSRRKSNRRYITNWSSTIHMETNIRYPHTLDELISEVKQAESIKPIGSLYSWSNIVVGPPYTTYISLQNIYIPYDIVSEPGYVICGGGNILGDILEFLSLQNKTLPVIPYTTKITVAGCISTSVHGTGIQGGFSGTVKWIEMVLADGSVKKIDRSNIDFPAFLLSCGSLGVIYRTCIRIIPLYYLTHSRSLINKISDIDISVSNTRIIMFLWDPYTNKCILYLWNRIPAAIVPHNYRHNIERVARRESIIGHTLLGKVASTVGSSSRRELLPLIYKSLVNVIPNSIEGPAHLLLPSLTDTNHELKGLRTQEMELCFPISSYTAVIENLRYITESLASEHVYLYIGYLFRFVNSDIILLAPNGSNNTLDRFFYVAITMSRHDKYDLLYTRIYEQLSKFGAKPHWGKKNPLTESEIRKLYDTRYLSYISAKRTWDPTNKFGHILGYK